MPAKRITLKLRRGAGLREIVVIVLVLGGLLLLLAPYLQQRRMESRRTFCEKRQWELAKALAYYEQQHAGFPGYRNVQAVAADGQRRPASWVFPVLPYIGYNDKADSEADKYGPFKPLHDAYADTGDTQHRGLEVKEFIGALVCPAEALPSKADERSNWLSYVVNAGLPDAAATAELPADWPANGVFHDLFTLTEAGTAVGGSVPLKYIEDHDGAENTLLLSENLDATRWSDTQESQVGMVWVDRLLDASPKSDAPLLRINQQCGRGDGSIRFARPSSYHPGGVMAAFCDRSTRFINEEIDYLVLVHLMTPDGREVKAAGEDRLLDPPFRVVVPKNAE